ncbi:hypothetical protein BV898_16973 [Hypsibius exemplaris]|uniref:Uncharacterized protein n=1 Tax=Hypsibius exemplaris TaxID=2072580 RepID=A0A9X6RMC5_HYPEX|nr:hypothetical protein BV898_16973 [Hypsibius exemplaris]
MTLSISLKISEVAREDCRAALEVSKADVAVLDMNLNKLQVRLEKKDRKIEKLRTKFNAARADLLEEPRSLDDQFNYKDSFGVELDASKDVDPTNLVNFLPGVQEPCKNEGGHQQLRRQWVTKYFEPAPNHTLMKLYVQLFYMRMLEHEGFTFPKGDYRG